ncbi:hypothetical protein ABE525_13020 [Pseudomonas wadenswilerensis]|uniref:hypothetical protein n=1 Tax=Pseudomonas wadenswilerensis TaxID=1785161 RepID=UPI0032094014
MAAEAVSTVATNPNYADVTFYLSIAAALVSLAILTVGYIQMKIASVKVRLDLYSKRFNVYLSALSYHQAVWGKGNGDFYSNQTEFIKCYRESRFLFEKKDGIYDALTKIKNCGGIIGVNHELEEDGRTLSGSNVDVHHERCVEARQNMTKELSKLEEQMAEYIDFKVVSGWTFF